MKPTITIVTLGVSNLDASKEFYNHGLGFPISDNSNENITFFELEGAWLALFNRDALANDIGCDSNGNGFRAVTLARNVSSKEAVDECLAIAEKAGAKIVKPAQLADWGGYSGYFSDPDGHLWEVAFNPYF